MTDRDTVRLLIADLLEPPNQLFSDDQLDTFLALNSDNVRRAAADALEVIATSEALVSKKIRTQDLSTDGPAVAAELRARATGLRAQADEDEGDDFAFEIVDTGCLRPPEMTEYDRQFWGL